MLPMVPQTIVENIFKHVLGVQREIQSTIHARPGSHAPCNGMWLSIGGAAGSALQKRNEINWLAAYKQEISALPPSSENDTVTRIRQFIEDNIQTELTREQLGRMLFMNPDYIARLFREKQGISLNDYIRNRRISHAKTLLRETSLPLTEVCTRVGYAYNTYFFNVFKKATGLSPSEYRNKFRVHR